MPHDCMYHPPQKKIIETIGQTPGERMVDMFARSGGMLLGSFSSPGNGWRHPVMSMSYFCQITLKEPPVTYYFSQLGTTFPRLAT